MSAPGPVCSKNVSIASAWEQLKAIRSAMDPDRVFAANHPVSRLWENGGPAD